MKKIERRLSDHDEETRILRS